MYLPLAVPEGRYMQLPYWEKAAGNRYLQPPNSPLPTNVLCIHFKWKMGMVVGRVGIDSPERDKYVPYIFLRR